MNYNTIIPLPINHTKEETRDIRDFLEGKKILLELEKARTKYEMMTTIDRRVLSRGEMFQRIDVYNKHRKFNVKGDIEIIKDEYNLDCCFYIEKNFFDNNIMNNINKYLNKEEGEYRLFSFFPLPFILNDEEKDKIRRIFLNLCNYSNFSVVGDGFNTGVDIGEFLYEFEEIEDESIFSCTKPHKDIKCKIYYKNVIPVGQVNNTYEYYVTLEKVMAIFFKKDYYIDTVIPYLQSRYNLSEKIS